MANGGQDTSAAATATIDIGQINKAPSTSSFAAQAYENEPLALTSSLFPIVDSNVPAEGLAGIILTSLPTAGTLTLDTGSGAATAPIDQLITKAELDAGDLVFAPATNGDRNDYASFGFEVVDTGSTANGGQNTSSAATATINVAAVNQAPTTSSFSLHVSENQSLPLTSSLFPFTDTNIPAEPLAGIVLTSLPAQGTLTLNTGAGAVTAPTNQVITKAELDAGDWYSPRRRARSAPTMRHLGSKWSTRVRPRTAARTPLPPRPSPSTSGRSTNRL